MARTKKTSNERKRKIGERTEIVERKLTQVEIEDARARVIDLFDEREELEDKLASIKADYKAKIAEVDSKRTAELVLIRSGRTKDELVVEEWLTDQNEVVRVNKATGLEIGNRRTATAAELQEELPIDTTPPARDAGEDDGEEELEREVAEDGAGDEFGEGDQS